MIQIKSPGKSQQLILTAVFGAGLAAASLWLAIAQKSWPAMMVERKVQLGEPLSEQILVKMQEQTRGLEETWLPGRHVHLPGLAARLLSSDTRLPITMRTAAFARGKASTRIALSREPADAHGWARLAMFEYLENGASREVLPALRMSIYAAPAMKSLVFWRLKMAGWCDADWDPEFESLVKRQIVLARRISSRKLAETVQGSSLEAMARTVFRHTGNPKWAPASFTFKPG